ncbi:hypothetical protein [Roseiarcus sp.]|uniref:hypothetical protein n=1 Tax=Roseiarcus sp. TaxID=1969460 RepID=UPI003F9794AC
MTRHKYAIGQIVEFDSRVAPISKPSGLFEVVRVLPEEDGQSRTYRIKSKSELFERSAKEYEIVAVDSPSPEPEARMAQWLDADPIRRLNAVRPARPR